MKLPKITIIGDDTPDWIRDIMDEYPADHYWERTLYGVAIRDGDDQLIDEWDAPE